jgi:hypothetical protein
LKNTNFLKIKFYQRQTWYKKKKKKKKERKKERKKESKKERKKERKKEQCIYLNLHNLLLANSKYYFKAMSSTSREFKCNLLSKTFYLQHLKKCLWEAYGKTWYNLKTIIRE